MDNKLTDRQQAVLNFIKEEILFKGYPPTVREICEAVGLNSPSTVHSHLKTLEKKGYIKRDPSKNRALEVVDFEQFKTEQTIDRISEDFPAKEMANIPMVGTITAGQPILAEENIEDSFPLPLDFLHSNKELFMLKVKGESMIEAGILDGDLIVVEKTPTVRNGEIAAVLVDDSATVKYFFKEKDYFRLQPANCTMEPIIVHDCQILGRVIALMRRF
ncbi:MAG: transcriptional repressor LexA [Bacillota bacterium]|jgi:repressor LexA